jgi:hypothetical protein
MQEAGADDRIDRMNRIHRIEEAGFRDGLSGRDIGPGGPPCLPPSCSSCHPVNAVL